MCAIRLTLPSALALSLAASCTASASETASDRPEPGLSGWVQAGWVSVPHFEGSHTSANLARIGLQLRYGTEGMGTFTAGTRGVGWRVDGDDWWTGILFTRHGGRHDGADSGGVNRFRMGSERLLGMGEVAAKPAYALYGGTRALGLPLYGSLLKVAGEQGGIVLNLGTRVEWMVSERLTLSVSPSATWANGRYMQTYFGVTSSQAASTGRSQFQASAGVKSMQADLTIDYRLTSHWSLGGGVVLQRLLGEAARSPVTERREQASGRLALTYTF